MQGCSSWQHCGENAAAILFLAPSILPARETDALFFTHPASESSQVAVSPAKAMVGKTSGHTKRQCAPGRVQENLSVAIFCVSLVADVPWQGWSQPTAGPQQKSHPLPVSQRSCILSWPSMGLGPPRAQGGGVRARDWKAECVVLCVFQLHLRVFLFSLEKVLYLACIYLLLLPVMGNTVPPELGCCCSCSTEAKPRQRRDGQPGGKGNYSRFAGNSCVQMG